jgi:hypothetical protein
MIQIKANALGVMPLSIIWFANKPMKLNCLNSFYKQSTCCENISGYQRKSFYTKIIDLAVSEESIAGKFDQNTIYEIRRSVKDGVTTDIELDINQFVIFYNLFANTKQLSSLGQNFYNYRSVLFITKAIYNQRDIVMHAYITDKNLKRVRLLHSASLFRENNNAQKKAVVGRANRLLHFKDMCLFKKEGYEIYDLGGYAEGTSDEALLGINKFKDSFGGKLIQESDYLPLPAKILSTLGRLFK